MSIAVIGLGKIGLPLAAQYASRGNRVIGCDVDARVVDAINAGRSHVEEEAGLSEAIAQAVDAGMLRATTDTTRAVGEAQTVVVIVPMMLGAGGTIDYSHLDQATRAVAAGVRRGTLVLYETTLPVGTTRGRLLPMLEAGSKLRVGADLFLAFSPERVYAGRIFEDLRKYPKVVGGVDQASAERAAAFYRGALGAEVLTVSNAETAEFTKLAETGYRDVNIALANQLALYAEARGVDALEAFDAANTQPFSHLHRPGIGVGGHCIPVYPYFLLRDAAAEELSLLRSGRRTNDGMAEIAVARLADELGGLRGRRVLVLGVSYREDVKELAYSVAPRLVRLLADQHAEVLVNDPLFQPDELAVLGASVVSLEASLPADAVVIQAFHRAYRSLDWSRFRGLKVILDGRAALTKEAAAATGASYLRIGLPTPQRARTE